MEPVYIDPKYLRPLDETDYSAGEEDDGSAVGDAAVSLGLGVTDLGRMAAGIGDLASAPFRDGTGETLTEKYDRAIKPTEDWMRSKYSKGRLDTEADYYRIKQGGPDAEEGFLPEVGRTLKAYAAHPTELLHDVIKSAPGTLSSGGVGALTAKGAVNVASKRFVRSATEQAAERAKKLNIIRNTSGKYGERLGQGPTEVWLKAGLSGEKANRFIEHAKGRTFNELSRKSALRAAAATEGAEAAGSIAAHAVENNIEEGKPRYEGIGYAVPAGAATALISGGVSKAVGGSLEASLFNKQAREQLMRSTVRDKNSIKSVLKGYGRSMAAEGGEEAMQAPGETFGENAATGRPLTQGLGENLVSSALAGAAMGGGMHANAHAMTSANKYLNKLSLDSNSITKPNGGPNGTPPTAPATPDEVAQARAQIQQQAQGVLDQQMQQEKQKTQFITDAARKLRDEQVAREHTAVREALELPSEKNPDGTPAPLWRQSLLRDEDRLGKQPGEEITQEERDAVAPRTPSDMYAEMFPGIQDGRPSFGAVQRDANNTATNGVAGVADKRKTSLPKDVHDVTALTRTWENAPDLIRALSEGAVESGWAGDGKLMKRAKIVELAERAIAMASLDENGHTRAVTMENVLDALGRIADETVGTGDKVMATAETAYAARDILEDKLFREAGMTDMMSGGENSTIKERVMEFRKERQRREVAKQRAETQARIDAVKAKAAADKQAAVAEAKAEGETKRAEAVAKAREQGETKVAVVKEKSAQSEEKLRARSEERAKLAKQRSENHAAVNKARLDAAKQAIKDLNSQLNAATKAANKAASTAAKQAKKIEALNKKIGELAEQTEEAKKAATQASRDAEKIRKQSERNRSAEVTAVKPKTGESTSQTPTGESTAQTPTGENSEDTSTSNEAYDRAVSEILVNEKVIPANDNGEYLGKVIAKRTMNATFTDGWMDPVVADGKEFDAKQFKNLKAKCVEVVKSVAASTTIKGVKIFTVADEVAKHITALTGILPKQQGDLVDAIMKAINSTNEETARAQKFAREQAEAEERAKREAEERAKREAEAKTAELEESKKQVAEAEAAVQSAESIRTKLDELNAKLEALRNQGTDALRQKMVEDLQKQLDEIRTESERLNKEEEQTKRDSESTPPSTLAFESVDDATKNMQYQQEQLNEYSKALEKEPESVTVTIDKAGTIRSTADPNESAEMREAIDFVEKRCGLAIYRVGDRTSSQTVQGLAVPIDCFETAARVKALAGIMPKSNIVRIVAAIAAYKSNGMKVPNVVFIDTSITVTGSDGFSANTETNRGSFLHLSKPLRSVQIASNAPANPVSSVTGRMDGWVKANPNIRGVPVVVLNRGKADVGSFSTPHHELVHAVAQRDSLINTIINAIFLNKAARNEIKDITRLAMICLHHFGSEKRLDSLKLRGLTYSKEELDDAIAKLGGEKVADTIAWALYYPTHTYNTIAKQYGDMVGARESFANELAAVLVQHYLTVPEFRAVAENIMPELIKEVLPLTGMRGGNNVSGHTKSNAGEPGGAGSVNKNSIPTWRASNFESPDKGANSASVGLSNAVRQSVEKALIRNHFTWKDAKTWWPTIKDAFLRGEYAWMFTETLIREVKRAMPNVAKNAKFLNAIDRWNASNRAMAKERNIWEGEVSDIFKRAAKLPTETYNQINEFIERSVSEGRWGFFLPEAWPVTKDNKSSQEQWDEYAETEEGKAVIDAFEALPAEAQEVIKDVFKHGIEYRQRVNEAVESVIRTNYERIIAQADVLSRDELRNDMEEAVKQAKRKMGSARSPYAPFRRYGDHLVVMKSVEYETLEKEYEELKKQDFGKTADDIRLKRQALATVRERLDQLATDPNHYYVEFVDGIGQATIREQELSKDHPTARVYKKEAATEMASAIPAWREFEKIGDLLSESHNNKNGMAPGIDAGTTMSEITKALNTLYVSALAQNSARKAEMHKRQVSGYDRDMMKSFLLTGRNEASQLVTIRHSAESRSAITEMRNAANTTTDPVTASKVANELSRRFELNLKHNDSNLVNYGLRTTSTMMLLTNPAFYLQNLMQPFVMSAPVIAGKYGYNLKDTISELASTAAQVAKWVKSGTELRKFDAFFDAEHADEWRSVQAAIDAGMIDIGITHDFGRINGTNFPGGNAVISFTERMGGWARNVETVNRMSTFLVAYRNEKATQLKNGATPAMAEIKAAEFATEILRTTHGDYSGFNAPRMFRSHDIMKIATQFKKFQWIQTGLVLGLFRDAFMKQDPNLSEAQAKAVKAIARRQLALLMATHFALSGLKGTPLVATAMFVTSHVLAALGMAEGGDDDEDIIRKVVKDKHTSDFLLNGLPYMLGFNIGPKVGATSMFDPAPFWQYNESRTAKTNFESLAVNLGGASVGLAERVWVGMSDIAGGNYWKGMEKVMPNGLLTNLSKAIRFETQGLTTGKGDVGLPPEAFGITDFISQGILGIQSSTVAEQQRTNAALYRHRAHFDGQFNNLMHRYIEAKEDGDRPEQKRIMKEWAELNKDYVAQGFRYRSPAQLTKGATDKAKRERDMIGGVSAGRSNAGFLKDYTQR